MKESEMTADTVELVKDHKVKGRIVTAIGRHMDLEAEQMLALEQEPLVSDGEGHFMLATDTENFYITIPLNESVTRITGHEGIGRVAESWVNGHLVSLMLVETEDT
jgi:hypothetical protein